MAGSGTNANPDDFGSVDLDHLGTEKNNSVLECTCHIRGKWQFLIL